MGRAGYSDDCDDNLQLGRWRGAVRSAIRGKRGQEFLKEMLAALEAMPQKRLIANVLEQTEWNEDGDKLVPVKDGDVCAFGAVGRARGISMPVIDGEDDDETAADEVARTFGTVDALTREIMWKNDEGGIRRRVPIPNVRRGEWDCWGYNWLPETPEERWQRMRLWVANKITDLQNPELT